LIYYSYLLTSLTNLSLARSILFNPSILAVKL